MSYHNLAKAKRSLSGVIGISLCTLCGILSLVSFARSSSTSIIPDKVAAGQMPWSTRAADKILAIHPHYINYDTPALAWNYEQGMMLYALWNVWENTKDQKYFEYVRESVDFYLTSSGAIKTYHPENFRLDDILLGRVVLDLYVRTKEAKYKTAAATLRNQLRNQPRTPEGGFWHKEIYPDQMWLDGLYMAEPFYAQYAKVFGEQDDYTDITKQFILMAKHGMDPKTSLYYHGWDFAKTQKWANPGTGNSPTFWGRAMGWYMMGIVDVLDYLPRDNPQRQKLISIFRKLSAALLKLQDKKTYMWYQVVDKPGEEGNYLESSSSAMFTYAFAKGAANGYLQGNYHNAAQKGFDGLIKNSVRVEKDDLPTLLNTCAGAGLGATPDRDGSYRYYVTVPKVENDFRGLGPFIMAALELEKTSGK